MTEGGSASEFEDEERPTSGPLLPPEDRLWRHPSEVASQGSSVSLDPGLVRDRWLERQPTRATAWTAGLVGALLATGIVLVGTHLASFLTRPALVEQTDAASVVPSSTGTTIPAAAARGYGLGASLAAAVSLLGSDTVAVHAFRGSTETESLGVVLEPGGVVVTAAAAVEGASSILVDPPHGGTELVAVVSGVDLRTGLATLHVNRMPIAPPTGLGEVAEVNRSTFVLAITSAGGSTYAPAMLTSVDITPRIDGTQVVDASTTDLASAYAPLGSPVLDSQGRLIGIVIGTIHGHAVLTPAWILDSVASELTTLGSVAQGWMGINGTTMRASTHKKRPAGVEVVAVAPRSAAADAGIATGDEITSIDDRAVSSITALQGRLYTDPPGTVVFVGVVDRGRAHTVAVTLAGSHG